MFTLLAEQQKKRLYREYRFRLLTLLAFFIAAFFIILSLMLLPSRLILSLEHKALMDEDHAYRVSIDNDNSKVLIETLGDIKSKVALAAPDDSHLFETLQVVLSSRPNSVLIRGISYTRGVDVADSLTITGVAGKRSDLIAYFRTLQKASQFSAADLPVGSLTKDVDVPFTINLRGEL